MLMNMDKRANSVVAESFATGGLQRIPLVIL
jgi:hypothetical protein